MALGKSQDGDSIADRLYSGKAESALFLTYVNHNIKDSIST